MAFSFTNITGLTSAQTNLYTAKDFRPLGKQSLLENKLPVLKGEKTIFILEYLQNFLNNSLTFFLVLLEKSLYRGAYNTKLFWINYNY